MSYNGSGTFNINSTGQPVVAGTVITASAFNALTTDLATGLTTAITKDGQTTTTARITFAQGITSSLVTDSSSVSTGSIITAGGAGIAKNLYVGVNANVAGTLGVTGVATFSAAPIYSSLTASSAVATDASKGLVSVTNTGTGNNVLATSPTLVTPTLGAASATSITVASGAVGTPSITTTGDTNTGIFFPAADTIAFSEGGAEAMRITSAGNVGIGTTSPVNNAGYGGLTLNGTSGSIYSMMYNGTENLRLFAGNNEASIQYGSSGVLTFVDGVSGGTERMRIDSDGRVMINQTAGATTNTVLEVKGISSAILSRWKIGTDGFKGFQLINAADSEVGSIVINNASTTYATSSDYRLKEDIALLTGALATVAALKPVSYKWKSTGEATQGFIAHELQAVVPECVVGEKDAVDAEGNPQYQGIDTSFLVATLTAAIQELKAINDTQAETINALTARIVALESK